VISRFARKDSDYFVSTIKKRGKSHKKTEAPHNEALRGNWL
jgi:hypothetical protein